MLKGVGAPSLRTGLPDKRGLVEWGARVGDAKML